ncbi:uncharacterized protein mrvi1 isoform X2 [Ictalurus punctatus]|uniref:Uncharacterized protein mrvi1 isoform X2 n=1 Tax=Ictalurus punctatus TaxID=7998 RepID=A0A2D0RTR7_ICTPU|nr:uncharacterized protein mrvi1 isoform X2 [Ictalurus punctatus]
MVLKHLLMTSSVIMASGNVNTGWSIPDISACRQTGNGESGSPSQQDSVRDGEHYGYSVSSLSGISSAEFSQLRSDDENFRLGDRYICDHHDMNGFSEEELLNITFEACDAAGRGEVLASTVVQFLQAMTGHSGGQDKLIILKHMLDPEDRDPPIDRDAFHTTMRNWIAQCSQDGLFDDSYQASGSDSCKATGNGAEFSPSSVETTFTDPSEYHCDAGDLLGLVAELKHAQRRLRGQNSSLLRSVSQCEETNLQLMMDVSELRSKLASAQLYAGRARSLAEELDEARRALRESQEKTSRAQANCRSLMKEIEHLKAHIKVIEEMNEKLLQERNGAEDRLNKLKRANADVREELEELQVLLAVKEREITKKNVTLQKLKETFLDYDRIVDGLQCDLVRLQEHSQQALSRFDICSAIPRSAAVPNHYSLHREIQEAEPMARVEENSSSVSELQPPSSPKRDLYNFIHKIKSAELRDAYTAESLQKVFLQDQQEQASSKKQLLTILTELDRPLPPWDQQPERRHVETHRQPQEVRKAPPITWWRALRVEDERNWNTRDVQDTTRDMQERISALEIQLKDAQMEVQKSRVGRSPELGEARVRAERSDVCIQTEQVEDERKRVAAEKVLESLRKVEVVVTTRALQAAEMLTDSERRMKERMEAISRKVEEALSRTADTENQLRGLEARVSSCTKSSDARSVDAGHHPAVSRNIFTSDPMNTKQGGCFPHAGAEDNSREGTSQDTDDATRTLNDSSEPVVKCEAVLTDSSSSDRLPVGLVNEQNPPVQNGSERGSAAAAHDPVPETSKNAACEERKRHDTRENGAGSEEPGDDDDSRIKSEERKNGGVSLEEADCDQSIKLEENKYPNHKQDGSSGSSELGPSTKCEVFACVEKGRSAEPEQCDQTPSFYLSEGASKGSGHWEEGSGTSEGSQEETNRNIKDSTTKWTCSTAESGNRPVQICRVQTAEPAGTLKKEISAECGTAGPPAKPSSTRPFHLAVSESHTPFFFPRTRSRPPTAHTMPTLPEEEEDSPEEIDSASSSPSSVMPVESKLVNVTLSPPAIVLPRQVNKQEPKPLEEARPHSPRPRLSRNPSSSVPITTVDNDGHVIDLVKDQLPEMLLSEEDRQKNLELLEEAKKVSDRFLTRRGRRSTCSLTDSPTALSPNPTPGSSPVHSRSSSTSAPPPQMEVLANPPSSPSQRLEVPAARDHGEANKPEQETLKNFVEWKPPEKRKVSSGMLTPRHTATTSAPTKELTRSPKDSAELCVSMEGGKKQIPVPAVQKPDSQTPATGVAKAVQRPAMQQAPCTAEIKTIGAFPPLMRAVSWDTVGSLNMRNGGPKGEDGLSYSDNLKPPENKLLRNQSISGSKLPDLSETAEQDRDPSSSTSESTADEELKEKADAMPNISDIMLRKLKLHRGLPGCAPPLTEKEVENAFVQLSLAFRNDNYTLDTRLKQAERERNLTEENTEKELEEFKNSLKTTVSLWQNAEQREFYQRLIETVAVLHRLANRLSSRAEMVGAVRQEKRMNKATEVMMQYVENLKRTYEKDHAELMEFKKLANQNSPRCYGSSMETGDDGVPRAARSMSLTMGKALPRRRVSVAVVPKFNLLNIPGQTPTTGGPAPGPGANFCTAAGPGPSPGTGPGALPVLCEANSLKSDSTSDPAQQTAGEIGKVLLEQEGETANPAKASCIPEEIRAEIKAKIEEEAYNKGYQEGLKRLKELQEMKEQEEKAEEKETEPEEINGEELEEEKKPSRFERVLEVLERICPKIFRRNRTLWIVLTLFLVVFLLVNLINFFSNLYADHADATAEKSNVPGKKKFLGLRVGSKSPSPE